MKHEKGIIAAVYKESEKGFRFLVLKRKKNWEGWELLKGHLENEDYVETVRTELREEAGIEKDQIEQIQDLEKEVEWEYERDGEKFEKNYSAFMVKVGKKAHVRTDENPHDEHEDGFFLRYNVVKDMLEYRNNVEVLEETFEKLKDS